MSSFMSSHRRSNIKHDEDHVSESNSPIDRNRNQGYSLVKNRSNP